jgi:hypothetical protein
MPLQHWLLLAHDAVAFLQQMDPRVSQLQSVSPQQQSLEWPRWPCPSPVDWQFFKFPSGQ